MKFNHYLSINLVLILSITFSVSNAQRKGVIAVSYADTTLRHAEKAVLMVDSLPFYPISIQIRLDKLRYSWGWDGPAREAVMARAEADGFNTVSIPIQWYEVEPTKNQFNWTILDEYLELCRSHHLRMEMLWFGANSGGHAQWLGNQRKKPVHLRVPDYVLYAPSPQSNMTTSDYTIDREMSDYTLDLNDNKLKTREIYVLSQVMAHVALWDKANGAPHTLVGVQIGNEVRGIKKQFPAFLVMSYLSDVASAVKQSPYVVWTRVNCVNGDTWSRLQANEQLRTGPGSNIDFVGIDAYKWHSDTDDQFLSSLPAILPQAKGNYRMIMEGGAEAPNADKYPLSALSGNTALNFYDMVSPDGHELYDRKDSTGFIPHGGYVDSLRKVLKFLKENMSDIARFAQGESLFVLNPTCSSVSPAVGIDGITFIPGSKYSQAVTIKHSSHQYILFNTSGGQFFIPLYLKIKTASAGQFDKQGHWQAQSILKIINNKIDTTAGMAILVMQ